MINNFMRNEIKIAEEINRIIGMYQLSQKEVSKAKHISKTSTYSFIQALNKIGLRKHYKENGGGLAELINYLGRGIHENNRYYYGQK